MRLILTLSIMLFTSCTNTKYSVPVELEQYIKFFKTEADKRGVPITLDYLVVEYADTPPKPSILATCYLTGDDALIKIYTSNWNTLNPVSREIVMLHELGHCVLFRDHLDTYNSFGYPNSVMNAYILNSLVYEANKDYYLNELFGNL